MSDTQAEGLLKCPRTSDIGKYYAYQLPIPTDKQMRNRWARETGVKSVAEWSEPHHQASRHCPPPALGIGGERKEFARPGSNSRSCCVFSSSYAGRLNLATNDTLGHIAGNCLFLFI